MVLMWVSSQSAGMRNGCFHAELFAINTKSVYLIIIFLYYSCSYMMNEHDYVHVKPK